MKPKNKYILLTAFALLTAGTSLACTSAIVSGRVTKDGKPMLWKHRDTGVEQNHIMHFEGPKYSFVGLIDTESQYGEDVWAGTNSVGFSIMNTASYNLKNDTLKNLAELEGAVMKLALGVCKDLKDFERFLDTLSRPRKVEANFGVIDALEEQLTTRPTISSTSRPMPTIRWWHRTVISFEPISRFTVG